MTHLEKVHTLSSHFKDVQPDQIRNALREANEIVRKHLNLPENIKLSGLRFNAAAPNEKLAAPEDCPICCTFDDQGNTVCGCC